MLGHDRRKVGCASCPCCIHPCLHVDLFVNIPIPPLPTSSNDLMVRLLTLMELCLGTWTTLCFLTYSGLEACQCRLGHDHGTESERKCTALELLLASHV